MPFSHAKKFTAALDLLIEMKIEGLLESRHLDLEKRCVLQGASDSAAQRPDSVAKSFSVYYALSD